MTPEPEQGQLQLQTPGETLRKAREEKDLSLENMASQLNLKIEIIKALESDQYDRLAAPTYTRGYLRSYARAVDVEPESLIELFNSTQDNTNSPEILPKVSNHKQVSSGDKPVKIVSYLISLGLALLILVWWQGDFVFNISAPDKQTEITQEAAKSTFDYEYNIIIHPDDPNYRAETSPDDYQETALTTVGESAPPSETLIDAPLGISGSLELGQLNSSENKTTDSTAEPENALTLLVKKESWIEIHDVNNKRLYLDLAKPGKIITVSGPTPYSILLGNAHGVRVQFNGKNFDLAPHIRLGVARLKIGE